MTKRIAAALAVIAILAPGLRAADAPQSRLIAYSAEEIDALKQHGPWPLPWVGDPSNRVSRAPAGIDLGERFFFDSRLSQTGTVSCASCHVPEKN